MVFPMALGRRQGWTNVVGRGAALRALVLVATGASLSACVSLPRNPYGPLPIDLRSPVSADIRSTSVKATPWPSFLLVPSQPTDVRPITAWNRNMFDILAERRQSQAMVIVFPQTLFGAQAFAQSGRARATPPSPAP